MRVDERFVLPADLREQYYARGHWKAEDLWTSFEATVARHKESVAFVEGERQITFVELLNAAVRFGTALRAHGLGTDDTVVIHGRHCLESIIAILGCGHAGVVVALLPHMFSVEQIRLTIDTAAARLLLALGEPPEIARAWEAAEGSSADLFLVPDEVTPPSFKARRWTSFMTRADGAAVARPTTSADDLSLLLFSSGTTGEPKGVMHSANTIRFTVETYARYQSITFADTSLVVTAFGFVGSSVLGVYLSFLCGCRTILQRSWSADDALALVERHRVSHVLLMPTHAIDILESQQLDVTDCTSLTRGVVAGLQEQHRLDARRRLCARPYPMYGMSESPAHVTGGSTDDMDDLRVAEGKPIPDTELRICDDDDRLLPAGTQGHILVRGPNRFLGYCRNDSLNRTSLTEDGYFRTGDVGVVDTNGFMTFLTRSKDIIRRGGVTITPADVEAALRPHPRLADVAVIGLPDARLGERTCACVITRDGQDVGLQDLTEFLEAKGFARYQWPEAVVRCESFPRTPSLKVQKKELRRHVLADLGGAT
jgi:cyclohexanecarboxylate-CoA ligase